MRLKTLTTLNTLLLTALCLGLGLTLWWSEQALSRPYRLMSQYLELSRQFQHDLADNIQAYLHTGDALRHQQALHALDSLQQSVDTLPEALAGQLQPSLATLHPFMAGDLLAAGKLAGDPQGLLLQAERDMDDTLEQLARYAERGAGSNGYSPVLFAAARQLLHLGQARARLLASGRDALADELEQHLQRLEESARRLDSLPLLGIEEAPAATADSFASLLGLEASRGPRDGQEQGARLKRELHSLLKRYPAELARTRDLIRQRTALAEASTQRIEALQTALTALEPLVHAEHRRIQQDVRLTQGLMIGLILLTALVIDRLQRQLTRALGGMVPALSAWAAGDFAQQVRITSKTPEVHAIETSLNRLRSYLTDMVVTLRQHAGNVVDSSRTLADLNGGLHEGARRQADDTAQIRDALGELEGTIEQVASGAGQAAEASRSAARAVSTGQDVIGQSLTGLRGLVGEVQANAQAIECLANETDTIGSVLAVIRSIAEQTNLLALNAAIEAARAGQNGRGFAVVAEEVRTLAQRTSGATDEIQQVIARLQQAARHSVTVMRTQVAHAETTTGLARAADDALADIVSSIATIGSMAERIAQATAQQHQTVREIRGHSERIYQLGDDNLGHIARGRQQSEALQHLGDALDRATLAFSV